MFTLMNIWCCFQLKVYPINLPFHKDVGLIDWKNRIIKIKAAEAEILSVPSMAQTPKTQDPTFPIMQLDGVFH